MIFNCWKEMRWMNKIFKRSLASKRATYGILFSSPFIIGFLLFYLTPLIRSVYFSLCNITASTDGIAVKFIGLANYHKAIFVLPDFTITTLLSFQNLAVSVPAIIVYSFFLSIVLNQQFRGRMISRVLFFLPVILYSGILATISLDIFTSMANNSVSGNTETEIITANLTTMLLDNLPLPETFYEFLSSAVSQIYTIVTSSGVQILIFLAGLQTISPSLYEASSMEGATSWENFWKITFPMLSPLILVNLLYTIIDTFGGLSNTVMQMIFNTKSDLGLSSAMSWIYTLFILIIISVIYMGGNRYVYYENN
jgi:ABC-type sugar transport system permease subunit